MKLIVLFSVLISFSLSAQELPGFAGCGDYLIKGILVKNSLSKSGRNEKDKKELSPVIYRTNSGTNSEMQFFIKESEDLVLISSYLDTPTEIKAHIYKVMDGTKGEIGHISKVTLRKSNPLEPLKDSGIFLLTPKACR